MTFDGHRQPLLSVTIMVSVWQVVLVMLRAVLLITDCSMLHRDNDGRIYPWDTFKGGIFW